MENDRFMKLEDAIEKVLKLARDAAVLEPTKEARDEANLAADVVEDFFVNNVFDGTDEGE